jgi:hypothetical protein
MSACYGNSMNLSKNGSKIVEKSNESLYEQDQEKKRAMLCKYNVVSSEMNSSSAELTASKTSVECGPAIIMLMKLYGTKYSINVEWILQLESLSIPCIAWMSDT